MPGYPERSEPRAKITIDVAIVGAGPSGLSTALHLLKDSPSWKCRILIIDKAIFPREKLCAGGITGRAAAILDDLNCHLDIPNFRVEKAVLRFGQEQFSFRGDPAFRVTYRSQFDQCLLKHAESNGIRIMQEQKVLDIFVESEQVVLVTSDHTIKCKVLVGADGTTGVVRKKLNRNQQLVGRLLEIRTPEDEKLDPDFKQKVASFDFSYVPSGLRGYYWDFPSYVEGKAYMNRGIFDAQPWRRKQRIDLKRALGEIIDIRGSSLDGIEVKGFGLHQFSMRNKLSAKRVLLVGDAAGTEALFAEGITCALEYGQIAAAEIVSAFESQDFRFASYKRHVLLSRLGVFLLFRQVIGWLLYRPWSQTVLVRVWRLIPRIQRREHRI